MIWFMVCSNSKHNPQIIQKAESIALSLIIRMEGVVVRVRCYSTDHNCVTGNSQRALAARTQNQLDMN